MNIKQKIEQITPAMIEWRHSIHEKPEVAYQEKDTSDFISKKLNEFGIEVHQGIGKTGIVGIIKGKNSNSKKTIGIRADMDALPMTEKTNLPYASKNEGSMHACGHDGHSTMLLGAALQKHEIFMEQFIAFFSQQKKVATQVQRQ